MSPTIYRPSAAGARVEYATGRTTLGVVLVARSARGLCAILLGDAANELIVDLRRRMATAELVEGGAAVDRLLATVIEYIESPGTSLDLPLDARGTAFQQRVWQALRSIPPGETATYTEIAWRIGAPQSARAVARACGANPLAVAIPCHRVVRADGELSGYRWGVERKRALLQKEGAR